MHVHNFSQIDSLWAPSLLRLVLLALWPAPGRSDYGRQHDSSGGLVAKFCLPLATPWPLHGILQARILEGLPFSSPGDHSDSGIKPTSPALQVDSLLLSHQASSWEETRTHSNCNTGVRAFSWELHVVSTSWKIPRKWSVGQLRTLIKNKISSQPRKLLH